TIGMLAVSGSERSSRVKVNPSLPGSWRSTRMRSGRIWLSKSLASSAEYAPSVVKPARSRTALVNSMLVWLSSTIRTKGIRSSYRHTRGLQPLSRTSDYLVQPAEDIDSRGRALLEHGCHVSVERGFVGVCQLLR